MAKKTFKQFQNDSKGLTDKQFGKLLDKKGVKRPDILKKIKEAVKRDEYGDPIGGPKISKRNGRRIYLPMKVMTKTFSQFREESLADRIAAASQKE